TRVMISIAQPPAVVETRMLGREIPAYPTQSDSRTPIFHVSPITYPAAPRRFVLLSPEASSACARFDARNQTAEPRRPQSFSGSALRSGCLCGFYGRSPLVAAWLGWVHS